MSKTIEQTMVLVLKCKMYKSILLLGNELGKGKQIYKHTSVQRKLDYSKVQLK